MTLEPITIRHEPDRASQLDLADLARAERAAFLGIFVSLAYFLFIVGLTALLFWTVRDWLPWSLAAYCLGIVAPLYALLIYLARKAS